MKIGNFQTALAQFLEGVRMIQRYHDDRTDVLVLSAKSGRNLRFQWRFWNFVFFQRISTKIETKSHFQIWSFLAENPILSKIPFYLEKPSKVWGKSQVFSFFLSKLRKIKVLENWISKSLSALINKSSPSVSMKTLQHEVPAVSQALTTFQWKLSTQIFVLWIFNFRIIITEQQISTEIFKHL